MSKYLDLKEYVKSLGLYVIEDYDFQCSKLNGLINNSYIYLSDRLQTVEEKYCVLAEELAHFKRNVGDITNLSDTKNRKQEIKAHRFAIRNYLVPLEKLLDVIIDLKENANYFNIAQKLGITEEWLKETIYYYSVVNDGDMIYKEHIVTFNPFNVRSVKDEIA